MRMGIKGNAPAGIPIAGAAPVWSRSALAAPVDELVVDSAAVVAVVAAVSLPVVVVVDDGGATIGGRSVDRLI